jgi:hypothetical protein
MAGTIIFGDLRICNVCGGRFRGILQASRGLRIYTGRPLFVSPVANQRRVN